MKRTSCQNLDLLLMPAIETPVECPSPSIETNKIGPKWHRFLLFTPVFRWQKPFFPKLCRRRYVNPRPPRPTFNHVYHPQEPLDVRSLTVVARSPKIQFKWGAEPPSLSQRTEFKNQYLSQPSVCGRSIGSCTPGAPRPSKTYPDQLSERKRTTTPPLKI